MNHCDSENLSIQVNFQDPYSAHNSLKVDYFSLFPVQNEIVLTRSPDTKALYPISSQRLVKSVAIQADNPIPVFYNSVTQTNIPDENTVFVKSIEFLLHTEMDQPTLPIIQLSINKVPENFLFHSSVNISLLSSYSSQQIKHYVHYRQISSDVKITNVISTIECSGCIKLFFKMGIFFYSHSFFLIDIPEHSKFIGLPWLWLSQDSSSCHWST